MLLAYDPQRYSELYDEEGNLVPQAMDLAEDDWQIPNSEAEVEEMMRQLASISS
jgi:hypothetical protein